MGKEPIAILKRHWGYARFRPLQEEIIQSALQGTDTLALLPTGGGKSICYQVPALARPGICLVVSPLIALMNDQVAQLQQRDIPAAAIHSGLSHRDIDRILDNAVYGQTKLLYLSPERLSTELAVARIRRMEVNLLAVDEAHCISQWGYDFRPAYLQIARVREWLPDVPVLALTATATPQVVEDIQDKLAFRKGQVFQSSFARDNLAYVVRREEAKESKLWDILGNVPGSGIVYVRNRRRTREVARSLSRQGISADYYHAGVPTPIRAQKQQSWMEGRTRIMVATNAFGMGIDKPDVRSVVHMDLPDSLEAYFQEAGRAGRDGQKAFAVLLYRPADRISMERMATRSYPPFKTIVQVYRALGSYFQLAAGSGQGQSFDFSLMEFCHTYQLDAGSAYYALKVLEENGWFTVSDSVYRPARLLIKVSKDALYDYQLKHPNMEPVLKSILRTYQGAFQHYIKLRESQLARFLKLSQEKLVQMLTFLHKDGIIDYQPTKDSPQLTFLRERVEADNLSIDHEHYQFLKTQHWARLRAAIAYAETNQCRAQQLLAYFGETDAPECGQCDVCLERKAPRLDRNSAAEFSRAIRSALQERPLSLRELLSRFPHHQHKAVTQLLQHMLEEGRLSRAGDKMHWRG
mgnify:CR=1 FL=1